MQVSDEFGQSTANQQRVVNEQNTRRYYSTIATRNHQQNWEPDAQVEKNEAKKVRAVCVASYCWSFVHIVQEHYAGDDGQNGAEN
jgi:hypothetical protein